MLSWLSYHKKMKNFWSLCWGHCHPLLWCTLLTEYLQSFGARHWWEFHPRLALHFSALFQIARWRPRFWTPVAEVACVVSAIKVAKFRYFWLPSVAADRRPCPGSGRRGLDSNTSSSCTNPFTWHDIERMANAWRNLIIRPKKKQKFKLSQIHKSWIRKMAHEPHAGIFAFLPVGEMYYLWRTEEQLWAEKTGKCFFKDIDTVNCCALQNRRLHHCSAQTARE